MTPTLVLLGLLVALLGSIYWFQERLIFLPEPLPQDFRFDFPGRFEELKIPVQGATLHALHFRTNQPRGVVLYLHGNAGSLASWGWVSESFLPLGYDVVVPDYRGYGKSTGRITNQTQLLADVEAVYQAVRERYPAHEIVLYGRSIGTGPAVWLAGRHPPRFLVLEAPYYSLQELARKQFSRLVPGALCRYPLPSGDWIQEVASPVFFLHGTQDELIDADCSRRLAERARGTTRVFLIDGGHHNDLMEFAAYAEALGEIFGPGQE